MGRQDEGKLTPKRVSIELHKMDSIDIDQLEKEGTPPPGYQ